MDQVKILFTSFMLSVLSVSPDFSLFTDVNPLFYLTRFKDASTWKNTLRRCLPGGSLQFHVFPIPARKKTNTVIDFTGKPL